MLTKYRGKQISGFTTILGILYFIWMVMGGFPTGLLYDLTVGTGTEQGQWPDESVAVVESREEIETYLKEEKPVTVIGDTFVPCPLLRLRDRSEVGEHYTDVATKYTTTTEEYQFLPFPLTPLHKALHLLNGSASYNIYYLIKLQDGSYLCIYFDDYLMLQTLFREKLQLPTGYIRYSNSYERVMLSSMYYEEGFDVNDLFVLDMYRSGKVNWVADKLLRFGLASVFAVGFLCLKDWMKKKWINRGRKDG